MLTRYLDEKGLDKMTLVWADGFDHYGDQSSIADCGSYLHAYNQVDNLLNFADPRTGTGCLRISTSNNGEVWVARALDNPQATMGANYAIYVNAAPSPDGNTRGGLQFCNAAGVALITLWANSVMGLTASVNANGHVYGSTAPNLLRVGVYVPIGIRVFVDAVHGSIEVRVNNETKLLLTDIDTTVGGAGPIAIVQWYKPGGISSGSATITLVDDWTVWDTTGLYTNDFLPDNRCRTRYALTDGPEQAWAITGAATAHAAIANVPSLDTQYISSDNVGDISDFGITQLPTNTSYCAGVNILTTIEKDAPGPCTVEISLKVGADTSAPQIINPNVGYSTYSNIQELDPLGNPWILAPLQATLIKTERTL